MRPLFGFVLFYGAWVNNGWLVALGVFGLSTSWFWFPKPAVVNPAVEKFIDIERKFVTPPWTAAKVASLAAVLLFLLVSLFVFWYHSLKLGLALMFMGGLAKSVWSLNVAGSAAYIPAFFGVFWAAASVLIYIFWA